MIECFSFSPKHAALNIMEVKLTRDINRAIEEPYSHIVGKALGGAGLGHRCQAGESDICVESLSLTQRARQALLQYSTRFRLVTININTLNMGGH